jgi:hypothetical protein
MKADSCIATAMVVVALSMALSSCSSQEPGTNSQGETNTASVYAADGDGLRAKALQQTADMLGIVDPPQVAIVHETSPFDIAQVQVDCLRAVGYDVEESQGGIHVKANVDNPTDEYWQQFQLASYVCEAQYPLAEIYYEPLTEEQKQAYADYYLDELPTCLRGFSVQFETPPSREVFLADFDKDGPWTPYLTAEIPPGQTDAVMAACPQGIPPDRLWEKPQ